MSLSDLINGSHDEPKPNEWCRDNGGNEIPLTDAEKDPIHRWLNTQGIYDPETIGRVLSMCIPRKSERGRYIRLHVIMSHEEGSLPSKAECKLPNERHEITRYTETRIDYDTSENGRNPAEASPVNRLLHNEKYSNYRMGDLEKDAAEYHGPALYRVDTQLDNSRILGSPLLTEAQLARYPDLEERWRDLVELTAKAMADEERLREKLRWDV